MQKFSPTPRDVHVPSVPSASSPVSKPWTVDVPPAVAQNWSLEERQRCVSAANKVLADTDDERRAIFACIRASGRSMRKLYKGATGIARPLTVLEKEHTGVMIALFLPPAAASKLALPGGEKPEELHVTLAFLGPAADISDPDVVREAIVETTKATPVLSGRLGGKIRFENPGQSEAAFCAVPDIPGLDGLRTRLVEALKRRKVAVSEDHGFNPHVTLKYVGVKARDPRARIESIPVRFGQLSLVMAEEREDFALKGKVEKARPSREECMVCKERSPTVEVLWANGKGHAWFCKTCFSGWQKEHRGDINYKKEVEFGVARRRFGDRKSPRTVRERTKKMDNNTLLFVNGDAYTLGDLGSAMLEKAESFTSVPWESPRSKLDANDLAQVSLVDTNESGEEKVKGKIRLPVRSRPGGPINRNALRNAASRLPQMTEVPDDTRLKAAKRLVGLMRSADIEPGRATLQAAGMTEKSETFEVHVEIVKVDKKKQVITGTPLIPGEVDSQGDIMTAEQIETAAWNWLLKSGQFDLDHKRTAAKDEIAVVGSLPLPGEMTLIDQQGKKRVLKEGTWVIQAKVFPADRFAQVENGEYNAFSIRGTGKRTQVE